MGTNEKKELPKILSVKSDLIFRLFFADERYKEDLIALLKAVLNLPEDDDYDISILDPHLLPEHANDKYSIIDVKLRTKSGKIIHIEIQLSITEELKKRIIYYQSKLITEQLGEGGSYNSIENVISIVILDKTLVQKSPRYHHRFAFADLDAGVELTDLVSIHTLELDKLPTAADGTELYDWASFIAASSEEEYAMVAERNPQISKAVVRLRALSENEQIRDLADRREKARRDEESHTRLARQEGERKGRQEGEQIGEQKGRQEERLAFARRMLMRNRPIAEIIEDTGLTREEIEALQQ